MSADLWQLGCERLAAELPEQQFNTWIRPLPAAEVTDQGELGAVVTVRVPNRFKDRKSTRLNSSHPQQSRMPSSA